MALGLWLGLTCIFLAVVASTIPMPGIYVTGHVTSASAPTAALPAVGAKVVTDRSALAVSDAVREVVVPITAMMSLPMRSMCPRTCVTDLGQVCAVAGCLMVAAVLVLSVAFRRRAFVGLLARVRPFAWVRPRPTPWTVLSPVWLCILRV